MKKFIALTIGLSFLGASFLISTSEASREAYHGYLYKKIKESNRYRNFAESKGTRKQIISNKKITRRQSVNMYARRYNRNLLFPVTGKRDLYSNFSNNRNLKKRTISNRFVGKSVGNNNTHRTVISTSKYFNTENLSFKNYFNDHFSLEVPFPVNLEYQDGELLADMPMSTVKFIAKKLENNCQDVRLFSLCARSASRAMDKKNNLFRTSKTIQQYQKTDSILGSMKLNKNKYVEGFIGVKKGKYYFVSRLLLEGNNGNIFLVEVTSNMQEANQNVIIAKRLFETFRARYKK